ncbi:hypothetical protein RB594_001005 [Gaeumannomyces avenae]
MKTILVVGATGAQGASIVQHLAGTNQYSVLALTRSASSPQAAGLAAVPNVELVVGNVASGYDEDAFASAAARSDFVLVNTDGFALGEKAEVFWGIRLFELASRAGVKHLIYSGLDNVGRESNYDARFDVGHYAGKARVQDWIHAQQDSKMRWTIIRSGPYLDQLSSINRPVAGKDGVMVFHLPLGDGAVPFIDLDDFGKYVHWALAHPEESNRLDFGIATEHVGGRDVAAAFTAATGRPARYADLPVEDWHREVWSYLPRGRDTKVGFGSTADEGALRQTYGENFTNWWNLYRASGGNVGLIRRDYEFLDRIVPDRAKSVAEWMRLTGYTGERKEVLKMMSDQLRSPRAE